MINPPSQPIAPEVFAAMIARGAHRLNEIRRQTGAVSYPPWRELMQASSTELPLLKQRVWQVWVWDALRLCPEVQRVHGDLPPGGVPWQSPQDRFIALPDQSSLVVGLKMSQAQALNHRPVAQPLWEDVSITISEALFMRPGKVGRLECCDVQAQVWIRRKEHWEIGRESDVMRVAAGRIENHKDHVVVRVDSLNQAYTVAARRLQPERRSHSGRIYDHLLYVDDKSETHLLEEVRRGVEDGSWTSCPLDGGHD